MAAEAPSRGLVPRSLLRSDSPPWLLTLVQQVGEARFGVEKIEELKLEDRRSWFTFTRTMAKAGGDFSKLVQAIEQLTAEETRANIKLMSEQALDLIERRKAETRLANKLQKREEAREDREQKQDETVFDEEQADRGQAREERSECHRQSLVERETRRKIYRSREIVLMSGTAACILFSFALIAFGLLVEKPLVVGGSSISASIAIVGFIKMFLGWRNDPPPPQDPFGDDTARP